MTQHPMCAQTTSFGFTELIRFYFHPQLFSPAPGLWLLSQLDSGGRDKKKVCTALTVPSQTSHYKVFPSPHQRISHLHCPGNKLEELWHGLFYGLGIMCFVIHVGGLEQPGVHHPLSKLHLEFTMLHEGGFCSALPCNKGKYRQKSQVLNFHYKK